MYEYTDTQDTFGPKMPNVPEVDITNGFVSKAEPLMQMEMTGEKEVPIETDSMIDEEITLGIESIDLSKLLLNDEVAYKSDDAPGVKAEVKASSLDSEVLAPLASLDEQGKSLETTDALAALESVADKDDLKNASKPEVNDDDILFILSEEIPGDEVLDLEIKNFYTKKKELKEKAQAAIEEAGKLKAINDQTLEQLNKTAAKIEEVSVKIREQVINKVKSEIAATEAELTSATAVMEMESKKQRLFAEKSQENATLLNNVYALGKKFGYVPEEETFDAVSEENDYPYRMAA